MDNRKQIMIGDYRVQQASNRHVSIVHMPEKHLVFHAEVDHWCNGEDQAWFCFPCVSGGNIAEFMFGKADKMSKAVVEVWSPALG